MLGYYVWGYLRGRFWRNPLALLGTFGLLLTLAHAMIDFPFQNPAVLITWCVLLVSLGRWIELERGPGQTDFSPPGPGEVGSSAARALR